jgi:pimeloyl-ACP methyl ester carboxylesterase
MGVQKFSVSAILLVMLFAEAFAQAPVPINGDWDGSLKVPAGIDVRLTLHLSGAAATMDSPDQGASGIPATLSRQGNTVTVAVPATKGSFTGTLSADGKTLTGSFFQGSLSMPAHFTRRAAGAAAPELDRPQTPHPPFPYITRDVSFAGKNGDLLAGTLTMPKGNGPFPAVVMIAGSGPQNRDENIVGHKLFLVIADRLTRAGVAVLRYDKRGVGASKGSFTTATTADFAIDAQDAVKWLSTQPNIARGKIGLIGHSEGAEIAPRVANRDADVAFVVLLSTPAQPGADIIASQMLAISLASGVPWAEAEKQHALEVQVLDAVHRSNDQASAQAAVQKVLTRAGVPTETASAKAREVSSPWFRAFLDDDPSPELRKLTEPTLVITGSKDLQVDPVTNLPIIRAALAKNAGARIVELPGLNHLLQPAKTGLPAEYGNISTTVDPSVLDLLTYWIVKQTAK